MHNAINDNNKNNEKGLFNIFKILPCKKNLNVLLLIVVPTY